MMLQKIKNLFCIFFIFVLFLRYINLHLTKIPVCPTKPVTFYHMVSSHFKSTGAYYNMEAGRGLAERPATMPVLRHGLSKRKRSKQNHAGCA
ncbi:UNVERIFIED_CONTAM: hypothetical protein FKN15_017316 [Acipenser sinensis]